MATVTGVSLQKVQQIEANTIISARVENGVLYFKKGDNVTEFSVGTIVQPAIAAWPVGSIFMNTTSTNPKTLLGLPTSSPVTFVRWGLGRVPVSLDPNNLRFDTSEEVGGAETVALDVSQMPQHNHGGYTGDQDRDHTHTGYAYPSGNHNHQSYYRVGTRTVTGGGNANVADSGGGYTTTSDSGNHDHSVVTNGASGGHLHVIGPQGGNAAHENMPPYITVYMWKRTV